MLRRFLVATVKHLVNVAMVADSVGRDLSQPNAVSLPIRSGRQPQFPLVPTTCSRQLQSSNYRVKTFYVVFVLCKVLQLP